MRPEETIQSEEQTRQPQGARVGHIHADVRLTNYYRGKSVTVRALVDTGTTEFLVTPQIARDLGFDLEEAGRKYVTVADGRRLYVPRLLGIQIHFEDRDYLTEALVMGTECLIGVVPLEVMDLIIDPKLQRLVGRLPDGPCTRA
jgi:clan AA aspartic protease